MTPGNLPPPRSLQSPPGVSSPRVARDPVFRENATVNQWRRLLHSPDDLAGQLLFAGVEGTSLGPDLRRRLEAVRPGGIILFARNLENASQVGAFCRELLSSLPIPPFLAIDQEGGRVSRLKGILPPIPANLSMARAPRPDALVREHGSQTGRALALLGFNLNFAPVLDLSGAESPNGIGDRAYGTDPEVVGHLARIFLEGQEAARVPGCGKHFPGLGGGTVDSHIDLPRIERSADEMWREDLLPYRRLRDALPMVMVGHAHYPSLQGAEPRPASLSREVVGGLLRERIGYRGVVLTDDLEMGAVDRRRPAGEVAHDALEAGNDMVMYCNSWDRVEEAHGALARALRAGTLPSARLESSLSRILALKERLPRPGSAPLFDPGLFAAVCRNLGRLEVDLRG
jgi:beta-N-acetylhexosaminidase